MVVFSFLGGGIADRVNKRNIMVALDFATSLLMVGLALALEVLPLVPLLIGVLMLLYGISGAYQPSVQASLPLLVPEEGLVQANALVNMVSTLAGLLGPVVGGVLFGAFGVYPIVLVSALCFFASAVMECFLRIPHNGRPRTDSLLRTVKGDLWGGKNRISYGLLFFWRCLTWFSLRPSLWAFPLWWCSFCMGPILNWD